MIETVNAEWFDSTKYYITPSVHVQVPVNTTKKPIRPSPHERFWPLYCQYFIRDLGQKRRPQPRRQ